MDLQKIMYISKIQPRKDMLLVRILQNYDTKEDGTILHKANVDHPALIRGEVVSFGPEVLEIEKGDEVFFPANYLWMENAEFVLLRIGEVDLVGSE